MKKKVIAISSWVGNRQSVEMSTLMLENVEALAAGENNSNTWCFGTGSVDCPNNKEKAAYVLHYYSLFD